jgi:hypothetical protein
MVRRVVIIIELFMSSRIPILMEYYIIYIYIERERYHVPPVNEANAGLDEM